jgi:NAD(P)-dependent dehydrogenase (short-subunit alcohol dehydrogenase family)
MNKQICLITGATNGIGKAAALALAAKGMHLVLTARNMELAERVRQEIISTTGNPDVDIVECNLASMLSVMACCREVQEKYDHLNILINNAGLWESERKLSRDGIELTFAVNHLAPFLMTNLLLDVLKRSGTAERRSRIITVSSAAHARGTINFHDLEGKQSFNGIYAYAQSKLANILFTKKLARLLQGEHVTANCLHPGVVDTNIFNNFPKIFQVVGRWFMLTPAKGAETTVYLATSPEVERITGEYFDKKQARRSSKQSYNEADADKLWEISKQYVGL